MTNAELESLIVLYLEGAASRQQVIRLRDAIKSSPELHQRFQARLRLHRAGPDGSVVQSTPALTDLVQPGDVIYVRESLF